MTLQWIPKHLLYLQRSNNEHICTCLLQMLSSANSPRLSSLILASDGFWTVNHEERKRWKVVASSVSHVSRHQYPEVPILCHSKWAILDQVFYSKDRSQPRPPSVCKDFLLLTLYILCMPMFSNLNKILNCLDHFHLKPISDLSSIPPSLLISTHGNWILQK